MGSVGKWKSSDLKIRSGRDNGRPELNIMCRRSVWAQQDEVSRKLDTVHFATQTYCPTFIT
jgi:hypothetical protein